MSDKWTVEQFKNYIKTGQGVVDKKGKLMKNTKLLPDYERQLNALIIGIDPDTQKSGVAVYQKAVKKLDLYLMSFFELFEFLKHNYISINKVVIEAGWENKKSNFHSHKSQSKVVGERIAKNVGSNHETGKKIVEMCEYLKVEYKLSVPHSAKTTPEYFKQITGIETKNQEKIDAAMLIIGM